MNFKKYQRRIPMNFKKIIPLTFTALCVAGALSACSDSTVVGADSQDNSVAIGSSSSVTPGSSGSLGEWIFKEKSALAALRSVSKGTAVTYSHTAGCVGCYQTDSVTAHETFDGVTQSIIDFDPTVRYSDTTRDSRSNVYLAMKDEEGFLHGEIFSSFGVNFKEVNCLIEQEGYNTLYQVYFNGKSAPNYLPNKAFKYLMSADFTLIEEFKKDCILENGEVDGFDGDVQVACIVNSEEVNGVETYKDPYWDKYAKYIIDNCVSTKSLNEFWFPIE